MKNLFLKRKKIGKKYYLSNNGLLPFSCSDQQVYRQQDWQPQPEDDESQGK